MSTIEEIRPTLRADLDKARDASAKLREDIEAVFRGRSADVVDAIDRLDTLAKQIQEAETLPTEFVGTVQNYRFVMNGKAPSHRFEVVDMKTGLVLHVDTSSTEFDKLLSSLPERNPEEETVFEPSLIDGQKITVKRKANVGIVPIRFGLSPSAAVVLKPVIPDLLYGDGTEVREGDLIVLTRGNSFAPTLTEDGAVGAIFPRSDGFEQQVQVFYPVRYGNSGGGGQTGIRFGLDAEEYPFPGYVFGKTDISTSIYFSLSERPDSRSALLKDFNGQDIFAGDRIVFKREPRYSYDRARRVTAEVVSYEPSLGKPVKDKLVVQRPDRVARTEVLGPFDRTKYAIFERI